MTTTSGSKTYFEYLRRRSLAGYLYRRFWLYPILMLQLHGRTLDVGCGIGDMLRCRRNTVGVDVNPETIKYCQGIGLDVHLMEEGRFPFPSGSFDSVILDNVLEHISEPRPLLEEIGRVLRPGGTFLVGVPGERGFGADLDHKRFYDEEGLRKLMVDRDYRVVRMLRMPLPIPALSRRLRSYCIYGVFRRTRI